MLTTKPVKSVLAEITTLKSFDAARKTNRKEEVNFKSSFKYLKENYT